MSADPVVTAHQTPGHLQFPENIPFKNDFLRAGGRVVCQPTGHLIFYRPDGRRFLATDPAGNPLHECEWRIDQAGRVLLTRARIKLDWGVWVGLKPSGLVNEMTLNLATKPGWQRLRADDLRAMAAQALRAAEFGRLGRYWTTCPSSAQLLRVAGGCGQRQRHAGAEANE